MTDSPNPDRVWSETNDPAPEVTRARFDAWLNASAEPVKPIVSPRLWQQIRDDFADFADMVTVTTKAAADALTRLGDQLREAGLVPDQPPTDPQARALWLRQHRNHGPARPGPQNTRRHR